MRMDEQITLSSGETVKIDNVYRNTGDRWFLELEPIIRNIRLLVEGDVVGVKTAHFDCSATILEICTPTICHEDYNEVVLRLLVELLQEKKVAYCPHCGSEIEEREPERV
jgi:hypothetical protein